jgi:cell wall-associated NlpC family hydrolase
MPGFYGKFTRVHLTGGGVRGIARTIRRRGASLRAGDWRRALPAGVAATAALGVFVGVGVTVLSGAPGQDAATGRVSVSTPAGVWSSGAASSVAALPPVSPVTGNASVLGGALDVKSAVAVPAVAPAGEPTVAPLRRTLTADLMVVAPSSLPDSLLTAIAGSHDVIAAEPVEAVRVKVNGAYTAILGVDPSGFRSFAAKPTAASDALWRGVASGGIAVSYTMGKLDNLPLGGLVSASGKADEKLKVVAFGTLGIGGVNAVVSHSVARSLGAPADNAIVISVRGTDISGVANELARLIPKGASVDQLVSVVTVSGSGSTASSGAAGSGPATLSGVPNSQINTMLAAAMSRKGKPYVWGGSGPNVFDCSGLVQWSFAQAGITMPRVAADQALTGPSVPVSQLQPGDLLFYHTDATAPNYISHVTIYLGNGWMIEAPQPGEYVQVVPADLGSEFAGAVRVNPAQAARVASGI